MSRRATTPAVAVALLVVLAVALGGAVAAGLGAVAPPDSPPRAALALSADAGADRVALTHRGGDALDVRDVRLRVTVDGDPLARQPPVPFFSARGFRPGPTGPFNSAADPRWTAGERAAVRLAATNAPALASGVRVRVDVYVSGHRIARLTATA